MVFFFSTAKIVFYINWIGMDFFSVVVKIWQGTVLKALREMVGTRMSVTLSASLCTSKLQFCPFLPL